MLGGVGVADERPILLGHEPRVAQGEPLDPPSELAGVGHPLLEGDGGVADERRVDGRAGLAVASGIGMADEHVADSV